MSMTSNMSCHQLHLVLLTIDMLIDRRRTEQKIITTNLTWFIRQLKESRQQTSINNLHYFIKVAITILF
jgi:hypothetical protein